MTAWLPIETAPKDGTRILVLVEMKNEREVRFAQWRDAERFEFGVSVWRRQWWHVEFEAAMFSTIEFGDMIRFWTPIPEAPAVEDSSEVAA